ncbi:MAG: DUF6992 family protein [Aggregatilineales bacterium]
MNIWQFNYLLSRRLMLWNAANAAVGLVLTAMRLRQPYWRAVGAQAVGWALVNVGIGVIGRQLTARRFSSDPNPYDPNVMTREEKSLRRLLWINTALLDPLYIIGGWLLARSRGSASEQWRGTGHGIIVQGVLLLVFDLVHVLLVPRTKPQ